MKTILYAWEIGDGFGHIRNLVAIARQHDDCHAVFAIPENQNGAASYLRDEGYSDIRFIRAPTPVQIKSMLAPGAEYRAASFVDVLACYGYDSIERFLPLYAQVNGIVADVHADVIVCESAPTFLIASQYENAWTIATGTSYGTPQQVTQKSRYPKLDSRDLTPLLPDAIVDGVISTSLHCTIRREKLADWFAADRIIPLCYPSLDLYEFERDEESIAQGPIRTFAKMPIISNAQFAYLSARHPQIRAILSAIRATGIPSRVYVQGAEFYSMSGRNMKVIGHFDLEEELKNCSRVIHHGSAGICQAAMGAGRAQFAFPFHTENTQNIAKMFKLSNVNAAGYAEADRYAEALAASYGVELIGAVDVADQLADKTFLGAQAVSNSINSFLESAK